MYHKLYILWILIKSNKWCRLVKVFFPTSTTKDNDLELIRITVPRLAFLCKNTVKRFPTSVVKMSRNVAPQTLSVHSEDNLTWIQKEL